MAEINRKNIEDEIDADKYLARLEKDEDKIGDSEPYDASIARLNRPFLDIDYKDKGEVMGDIHG